MPSFCIAILFLTQDMEVNKGLGVTLCIFQWFWQNMSNSFSLGYGNIITNYPQHWDLNQKFWDEEKYYSISNDMSQDKRYMLKTPIVKIFLTDTL